MNYNDLTNPKLKELIDGLKYNSTTIVTDMYQAINEADTDAEFIRIAQSFLDNLNEEVQGIRNDLIKAEKAELTIYMEGGVIQDITGIPEDINLKVVDWDVDGIEENRLTKIGDEMALVTEWESDFLHSRGLA